MGKKAKTMGIMKKIIIVHGWTYSLYKWNLFMDRLKKDAVSVTLLKIPGLTAPLHTPWTLSDYVLWLKKIIDQEKCKIILIGHSNGGRIAGAFSAQYPEKIAHLILIDSAGIIEQNIIGRLRRWFFKLLTNIGKKLPLYEKPRSFLQKLAQSSDYHYATPIMRHTMINLISTDCAPYFSKITIPTLIIWGEKDSITPITYRKKIQRLIPHSTLSVIKLSKHSPYYTHTEEVYKIIKKIY